MKATHVVFGAAGGLGSAIARKLVADGQHVRGVVRSAERARQVLPAGVRIEVADATDPRSTQKTCRDAGFIYHCINVPFDSWETLLPRITENILAGACAVDAILLFPGNVYGYGPLDKTPVREDHPMAATSRKGQLRNRMEKMLLDAHRAGQVHVVIPRFTNFYGPNVTSRLTLPIFRAAMTGAAASWPAKPDVPHDLVYVHDAAAASVLLAKTRSACGQTWHVPGPGPLTGRQFVEMVYRAAGTEPRLEPVTQEALKFSGGAMADTAELADLMYLYERPLVLDGSKFAKAFPTFRYTPHADAILQTVEWLQQHSVV
jgi:nucleoside-diphosphate-sugar epimerase